GVKKVSVATPYESWLNKKVSNFLQKNNIDVVDIKGLSIPEPDILAKLTPEHAYELACKVDHPDADAIFISCTAFRTVEIIKKLEKDLRKPVITSNQATMWKCFKMLNINEKFNDFG